MMIVNMRDIGGIKTAEGKSIRKGMLVRSANLGQAAAADLEGISTVIDLRTSGERQNIPDRVYGREYLCIPIFDNQITGISHEKETDDAWIPDLAELYFRMIRERMDPFLQAVRTIFRHDYSTGAVLWHCTEGKDRCGITTMLVLEALGVDRRTILDDYLKTNEVSLPKAEKLRASLLPAKGKDFAEKIYQAYIADEHYLNAAWEAMDGMDLREMIGCELTDSFRELILE